MLGSTALEILELTHIPGGVAPHVYGVGLGARRITFSDQQRRAINLVSALLAERRLFPGDSIAVIGAGVAGVTAAAYALERDLRVSLFEAHADPFAIQRGSSRWLHPNIYDWPHAHWDRRTTAFPVMNWTEHAAVDVIRQLRAQWRLLGSHSRLTWCPRTQVRAFRQDGEAIAVLHDAGEAAGFKAVLLAIGFGEEPEHVAFATKSYWRDDDLHQRVHNDGPVLISGCGDGGLIDAIRVSFTDYQQATLVSLARRAATHATLCETLRGIERNTPRYPDGEKLTAALVSLDVPLDVDAEILDQVAPNAKVLLNSGADGPLNRGSSLLNRFLIARLIRAGHVEFRRGRVDVRKIVAIGSEYSVEIGATTERVRHVVLRHGPSPSATRIFPNIDEALQSARAFLRTYSAGVDRTRTPIWMGEYPNDSDSLTHEPQNSSRAVAYISEEVQVILKTALLEAGCSAVFEAQTDAQSILLRIERAPEQPLTSVKIDLSSATELRLTVACGAAERPIVLTLSASPIQAPREALHVIQQRISEVTQLILEGGR